MKEIICALTKRVNGDIEASDYVLKDNSSNQIENRAELVPGFGGTKEILENDKRFGVLKPKNGKSYGYYIKNKDLELTNRQVRKMITRGIFRWYIELDFEFHRANDVESADLVFEFRSEQDDPLLSKVTLAYMFYPLGGPNNGLCVINIRPWFTLHGEGIDIHFMDPVNYPEMGSGTEGSTIDGDQVIGHELGHGLLGLPHVAGIMAPNYSLMEEFPVDIDVIRGSAKIPKRSWTSRKYKRLKEWLTHASER
jgi:hypothetical protein